MTTLTDPLATLEWYAEKATAMKRYMEDTPPNLEAMISVATEMSLDGGNRAQKCFDAANSQTTPLSGLFKLQAEAAALKWATMDGKKDRFLDDKAGKLGDMDGTYEGYMYEAGAILQAALDAIPHLTERQKALIVFIREFGSEVFYLLDTDKPSDEDFAKISALLGKINELPTGIKFTVNQDNPQNSPTPTSTKKHVPLSQETSDMTEDQANLIDLIGEFGREVYYLLDDCETSEKDGEIVHAITTRSLDAVSALLDRIDDLPFEEPGLILGPGAMLQDAIKHTFLQIEKATWPYGGCDLSADIPCNPFDCCEICQVPGAGKHSQTSETLHDNRLTQAEFQDLFGDEIPIEIVSLVHDCPDDWTLRQLRAEVIKRALHHWRTSSELLQKTLQNAGHLLELMLNKPTDGLKLTYTNHRGETAIRELHLSRIYWGSTEWHPEPQLLLKAFDREKDAYRDFAVSGFHLST